MHLISWNCPYRASRDLKEINKASFAKPFFCVYEYHVGYLACESHFQSEVGMIWGILTVGVYHSKIVVRLRKLEGRQVMYKTQEFFSNSFGNINMILEGL